MRTDKDIQTPMLPPQLAQQLHRWRMLVAILAVALVSLVMLPLRDTLGVINVMLLFLIVSMALGLTLGADAATLGAILSFVAFDVFFIEPYLTLTIAQQDHVLVLVVFLAISILSAQLMERLRRRTQEALREGRRTKLLFDLNRELLRDVTAETLLVTISDSVVSIYGAVGCRVLSSDDDGQLRVLAASPAGATHELNRQESTMAQWAIDRRVPAGLSPDSRRIIPPHTLGNRRLPRLLTGHQFGILYVPITTADRVLGVLEVTGRPYGGKFTAEDEQLLASFADQAALAMESARLATDAARAAALQQSDALKSSLLAAVSHDLRTPLTSIKASASALLDQSVNWENEARQELLKTIDEESDRLTLMVSNLLDLSRIEGGVLKPDRDWHDVAELVHDAVRRQTGCEQRIVVEMPDELPLAYVDYVQVSQVLTNLITNACKFSPNETSVTVSGMANGDEIVLRVADVGPGIPVEQRERVFDAFYRAPHTASVQGSGIGLSISKGLIEAHGGTISVEAPPDGGTIMVVRLPLKGSDE